MPKKILTARFCESVKPPESGRDTYTDAALPGFRFRVYASGKKTFSLVHRGPDGRQRRLSWSLAAYTLADARAEAEAALRAVARGETPTTDRQVANAKAVSLPGTVGALCDRYVEQHLKKNVRRPEAAEGEIDNHIRPRVGHLQLAEIGRAHVREMLSAIEAKHPVAANRALSRLRAVFNWAIERDLAATNPTAGIKKPTREKPASRVLSDKELAAVWKASGQLGYPGWPFMRLLILSGQRRDDVRMMRWSEIDLARGDWVIPAERYKNGRAHLVPLGAGMIEILEDMPFRDKGEFVLSPRGGKTPYTNVQRPKDAVEKASGVGDWTLHDLRRTMRTGLSRLGIRPEVSERVIGHAVGGALGRVYDHYEFREEKLAALDAWRAHVMAVVDGRAGANVVALREAAS